MIVWHNSWFPFGRYRTLNFFGILCTKNDYLTEKTINHEMIHTKQMIETLFIGFYLWYGIEYLIIRFWHKKQNCSYHDICFEEEAYEHDDDLSYLSKRKHYEWTKFVKIRSNLPTTGCKH